MRFIGLCIAAALVLVTGCAGGLDAREAQKLLREAQAQQLKLRSAAFVVKLDVTADGQRFGLTIDGAAETRARKVGDMYVRMTVVGMPGAETYRMAMAKRGSRVTMTSAGRTETFDVGDREAPAFDGFASIASFDFSSCIERFDVTAG